MNRIILHITVIFLIFFYNSYSCINEYRTLLNGDIIYSDKTSHVPKPKFNPNSKELLLNKLKKIESIYNSSQSLEDFSDLGSMYIYKGKYEKAKAIFLEIEKITPNLYQTASNLGTTYELLGQNDSALFWINKALKINPDSHNGSEWIHIKILEFKIKSKGNEDYLLKNKVLNLDFGIDKVPKYKGKYYLDELSEDLYYQLSERIFFVQPIDPIVAQLLFDLGNVVAITREVKTANEIFDLAIRYGMESNILDKRIKYFKMLKSKYEFKEWYTENIINIVMFGIVILITLLFIIIKFRKVRKSK